MKTPERTRLSIPSLCLLHTLVVDVQWYPKGVDSLLRRVGCRPATLALNPARLWGLNENHGVARRDNMGKG